MTTELLADVETTHDARLGSGSSGRTDKRAEAAIAAIREEGKRIERREIERLFRELDADGDDRDREEKRAAIEALAGAVVGRLLAVPIASLRETAVDDRTIEVAIDLFDSDFQTESRRTPTGDGERTDAPEEDDGN